MRRGREIWPVDGNNILSCTLEGSWRGFAVFFCEENVSLLYSCGWQREAGDGDGVDLEA